MKFTPETLIQIYLDGSFTEEAQSEFDALMRKDPAFAQQVTEAVAERVGPVPESLVEEISGRLDTKIGPLWQAHRPSPMARAVAASLKGALLLAAGAGIVGALHHYWPQLHQAFTPSATLRSPMGENPGTGLGSTVHSEKSSQTANKENGLAGKTGPVPKTLSSRRETGAAGTGVNTTSGPVNMSFLSKRGSGEVSKAGNPSGTLGTVPAEKALSNKGTAPTEEGFPLRISVETPKTPNVVVTVLDANGLLIRNLYQGDWEPGVHLLDWDGKDEIGSPVAPGNYTVVVNANGKTMSQVVSVKPNQ